MAEVDLGVRLWLNDLASGGLGAFTAGLMGLLNIFGSGIGNIGAMKSAFQSLGVEMQSMYEEYRLLAERAIALDDAFAAGRITMDAYTAATIENQLAMDALGTKIEETGAKMDALEAQIAAAQLAMSGLGIAIGGAIDLAAFGGAIALATKDAGDLQTAMAGVQIAVHGASENLDALTGYLNDVADHSLYSSAEVARAFELMGEKGFTASDLMSGLGQTAVQLSEALGPGGGGLTTSTNLLTTTMALWNAKAQDAQHYADLLTYAFHNGVPDAAQLQQGLQQVGARASALGVSLNQIIPAFDTLSRAMGSGSQAGASLLYMLTSLSTPIPKAQNELQQLGIVALDHVTPAFQKFEAELSKAGGIASKFGDNGKLTVDSLQHMFNEAKKLGTVPLSANFYQWGLQLGILKNSFFDAKTGSFDFNNAIDTLWSKLKGLPQDQQLAIISNLFNVKSGRGALDLLTEINKLHDATHKLKQAHNAQGLAAHDAKIRTDTLPASFQMLGTTITTFLAQTGTPFQKFLQPIVQGLNDLVSKLVDSKGHLTKLGSMFLVIGAALSAVAVIVGLVMLIVATPIGPVVGIILAVAAAIPLLSAGITWLITQFQQGAAWTQPFVLIWQILSGTFTVVWQIVVSQLVPAWQQFMNSITPLLPALKEIGITLLVIVLVAIGVVVAAVLAIVLGFVLLVGAIAVVIAWLIRLAAFVIQGWQNITGQTGVMINAIITWFQQLPGNIQKIFNDVISWINTNFVQAPYNWGMNMMKMLGDGITAGINWVKNAVTGVANQIKTILGFHSPPLGGPLADSDQYMPNMVRMFAGGITNNAHLMHNAASSAATGVRTAFATPGTAGLVGSSQSAVGGGQAVINFNLDSKLVAQATIDRVSGQLKMNGSGRLLR